MLLEPTAEDAAFYMELSAVLLKRIGGTASIGVHEAPMTEFSIKHRRAGPDEHGAERIEVILIDQPSTQ